MIKILKQPFPLEKNPKRITQHLLIMSLLVYFILVVFKPFGLEEHYGLDLYVYSGGFVLLGLVYLLFHFIIIESLFNEATWTLGKEVLNNLLILMAIGIINAIYYSYYDNDRISIRIIIVFVIYTLLIGIIPVTVNLILRQNRLTKYHQKIAGNIDMLQQDQRNNIQQECVAKLKSLNPEKSFYLKCNDLILLHAQDNYVRMFFVKEGNMQKELIRNTMNQCTRDLDGLPMFFRCHRSYIVNLDKLESIEGNAQGLKLKLGSIDEKIPVSRYLIKAFRSRMMQLTT